MHHHPPDVARVKTTFSYRGPACLSDVRSTAEQRCVKRIVDKFRIVWDEDPGARKRLLAMLQMPQTSLPRSYVIRL